MKRIIPVFVNNMKIGKAEIDWKKHSIVMLFDDLSVFKLKKHTPIDIHINYLKE